MDSLIKTGRAVAKLALSSDAQQAVLRTTAAVMQRPVFAIEAPPPRADIVIELAPPHASGVINLEAFVPTFASVKASDGAAEGAEGDEGDVNSSFEDVEVKGTVKIDLNQDFDDAVELTLLFNGTLDVMTEELAHSWMGIGASPMKLAGKPLAASLKRPVAHQNITLWRASTTDADQPRKLAAGTHEFPFAIKVSKFCPASTRSERFSIVHNLTARLVTTGNAKFSELTREITVRRVRRPETTVTVGSSTAGTSRDGLVKYTADTVSEVVEGDKWINIVVTLSLAETGIEYVKGFSAVFKQATRFIITYFDWDVETHEKRDLKALVLHRFKAAPKLVIDLSSVFPGSRKKKVDGEGVKPRGRFFSLFSSSSSRSSSLSSLSKSSRQSSLSSTPSIKKAKVQEAPPTSSPQPEKQHPLSGDLDANDDGEDDVKISNDGANSSGSDLSISQSGNVVTLSFRLPVAGKKTKYSHLLAPDLRIKEVRRTHHVLFSLSYRATKKTASASRRRAAPAVADDLSADMAKEKREKSAKQVDWSELNPDRDLEFAVPIKLVQSVE